MEMTVEYQPGMGHLQRLLTPMGEQSPCSSQAPPSVQEGDGGGIAEKGGSREGGGSVSPETPETTPQLNSPGPEDRGQDHPKRGKGQGKAPIKGKDNGDPLEKMCQLSGLPALEELLKEFQDLSPEDLPAETPPDLEITMRIPIRPLPGALWGQMPPSSKP